VSSQRLDTPHHCFRQQHNRDNQDCQEEHDENSRSQASTPTHHGPQPSVCWEDGNRNDDAPSNQRQKREQYPETRGGKQNHQANVDGDFESATNVFLILQRVFLVHNSSPPEEATIKHDGK
jgi:hypothetical protein